MHKYAILSLSGGESKVPKAERPKVKRLVAGRKAVMATERFRELCETCSIWRAARQCGGDLVRAVPVSRGSETGSDSQARPPSLQQTAATATRGDRPEKTARKPARAYRR